MAHQISGAEPLLFRGTILPANGTVSQPIDITDATITGLIVNTSMTLGTLTFLVSDTASGTFVNVKDSTGTNVSVGPVSGTFAVSATVLAALMGYRHLKIQTSSSQSSGLEFILPARP